VENFSPTTGRTTCSRRTWRRQHRLGFEVGSFKPHVTKLLLYQVIYIGFPDGQMVAGSSGVSDEAGLPGSKDAGEEGRALPILD
jgi:hypothetical protein